MKQQETFLPRKNAKNAARRSRNHRSADSLVRRLLGRCVELADKAVRAPGASSQHATKLGDSTTEKLLFSGTFFVFPVFFCGHWFS